MTFIYYEVFPVTLVSKQAVFIRHYQEKQLPPWIIPSLSNVHPNDIVVHHLINFFGDAFDPHRTIVHSTSWRYEDERDRLLLTYLAVLPQGTWIDQWLKTELIQVEPIGAVEKRYGDHLFPPEQIERHYVLGHALDHPHHWLRMTRLSRPFLNPNGEKSSNRDCPNQQAASKEVLAESRTGKGCKRRFSPILTKSRIIVRSKKCACTQHSFRSKYEIIQALNKS